MLETVPAYRKAKSLSLFVKLSYMLEMRRLRLLRELALRGTVSEVARAVSMTSSAVSQQLALLQRETGIALYIREGRRLRITDAGRLLVSHTERLLAGLEEAESELAELAGSVSGPVRLSTFPTVARTVVPEAVARCRTENPDLRVIMDEREAPDNLTALLNHDTDLALVYEYNLLPPITTEGLTLRPVMDEHFVILLPPDREPPEGPLPLASLAEETWISAYGDTAGRSALDRACAMGGFTPRIDYASNDYTVVIELVRAGLGVALVPWLALESGDTDIVVRPVSDTPITRTIWLATRSGTARSPALRVLAENLAAVAEEKFGGQER